MLLYIARHAWAGHYGEGGWSEDSLRELTLEGIERYKLVIEAMAAHDFAPQQIATSPYARCRQTADLIAAGTPHSPGVKEIAALEPGSDLPALLDWSAKHTGQDLCWVGHKPDVSYLTAALLGDHRTLLRFAKGAIVALRFDADSIQPGEAKFHWQTTAKSLGIPK